MSEATGSKAKFAGASCLRVALPSPNTSGQRSSDIALLELRQVVLPLVFVSPMLEERGLVSILSMSSNTGSPNYTRKE